MKISKNKFRQFLIEAITGNEDFSGNQAWRTDKSLGDYVFPRDNKEFDKEEDKDIEKNTQIEDHIFDVLLGHMSRNERIPQGTAVEIMKIADSGSYPDIFQRIQSGKKLFRGIALEDSMFSNLYGIAPPDTRNRWQRISDRGMTVANEYLANLTNAEKRRVWGDSVIVDKNTMDKPSERSSQAYDDPYGFQRSGIESSTREKGWKRTVQKGVYSPSLNPYISKVKRSKVFDSAWADSKSKAMWYAEEAAKEISRNNKGNVLKIVIEATSDDGFFLDMSPFYQKFQSFDKFKKQDEKILFGDIKISNIYIFYY